jgi:hypothetical protein
LALLLLLAGSIVLLAANAQYASAQSDTGDLFGDGTFEDLIVNGAYTPMKTSGLKWNIILQRLDRP